MNLDSSYLIYGLIVFLVMLYWEQIKINLMVFLIISRGIIAPNRFWWGVSERLLGDASGVEMYRRLKNEGGGAAMVPVNFWGTELQCVVDVSTIKEILDQSPHIFGVGILKKNFFSSFMSKNVGVSEGVEWVHRRRMNELVLESDRLHHLSQDYFKLIGSLIDDFVSKEGQLPRRFSDWSDIGHQAVMSIVFGSTEKVVPEIFSVFSHANSILAIGGIDLSKTHEMQVYLTYLNQQIDNPVSGSLIEMAVSLEDSSTERGREEIIHQIPHWIFPSIGQFVMTVPRVLLMLAHHPLEWERVESEIRNLISKGNGEVESGGVRAYDVWKLSYMRKVILETLRLNNPVVTTFRTLLEDYQFTGQASELGKFRRGQQFVILNNPVLRDDEFWERGDEFIPSRWSDRETLEKSYWAIMFNQGPQKCPGKELALVIIASSLFHIFRKMKDIGINRPSEVLPKLNLNSIEQMINPFSIQFQWTA